jgi:ketosteroid isomerase-like protein
MQRSDSMTVELPKPVAEYFAAANTDDAERVAACFTDDAIVHDEGGDYRGRAAIRDWAEEVRRKYHFHAEPTAVEEAVDRTTVTAHLTGNFPGNPVDLGYRFRLAGSRIAALDIG